MAKAPNYTEEQTQLMVGMYVGVRDESQERRDEVVEELAAMFNKSPRSIRAKLSREDVYVAKAVVSKVTGEAPAKKIELAARLREVSGANINVDNVAKMNKVDISRLIEAFEARDADALEAAEAADETESEEG